MVGKTGNTSLCWQC